MKQFVIAALAFLIIANRADAQSMGRSYRTALGVKFYPGAITVKHFVQKNQAIEVLGYFWNYGNQVTFLYELHGDIKDAPGLKWYIGPGAHLVFWNDDWRKRYPRRFERVGVGLDGVLGLDYKINGAPINVSLDWQPSITAIGTPTYLTNWGGLAFRYTF